MVSEIYLASVAKPQIVGTCLWHVELEPIDYQSNAPKVRPYIDGEIQTNRGFVTPTLIFWTIVKKGSFLLTSPLFPYHLSVDYIDT